MDAYPVALGLVGVAVAAWILVHHVLFRVAGTWEKDTTSSDDDDGRPERITLAQIGPLVTGRRDVRGGWQEYSGILIGRTVTLTRRDHGKAALASMGFPEPVAHKLDGEVMARLKLTLVDGVFLDGTFEPQKIEFTHQPPRVTGMYFLPAKKRRYRRVEPVGARERVPVVDEVADPTA